MQVSLIEVYLGRVVANQQQTIETLQQQVEELKKLLGDMQVNNASQEQDRV